jgi:hypothetical protein
MSEAVARQMNPVSDLSPDRMACRRVFRIPTGGFEFIKPESVSDAGTMEFSLLTQSGIASM